ncbi:MAG: hypothetical protein KDA57_05165 [Planctomycetales bacterium]|nr:hypothetical protein [Planctomycetales bacterium]
MLTRLTHAAIAFAVTVVVYQMYVLAVVPFVEPSLVGAGQQPIASEQDRLDARQAVHKHRELLAAYFPPDHWTLKQPPITFQLDKAMFVIDDYRPNDQGQLRVKKCAILFFPTPRVLGQAPPRDAIVLEAPHGAVMQMDEAVPSSGFNSFGRIQWAKLSGDITVHSDMREPGPEDDLLLTTRDVNVSEDLIRTESQVEMRIGPHWGRGRVLEIRLVALERARSRDSGPSVGGIDSLEISYEVEAQFLPGKAQLMGDLGHQNTGPANPPVKVTSQGPFRFDFAHQAASFSKQVELVQMFPDGKIDRLTSDKLNLYFAKNQPSAQQAGTGISEFGFHPGSIEALGIPSEPVELDSQSQQATARCQRLYIEVDTRRVILDRSNEVTLTYQGNEVHAQQVRYQAPPAGSPQRVGTLQAAGHGWLRAIAPGQDSQTPFEVRWTESMSLDRVGGKPVLTLKGRPRLDMVGMGRLWADKMTLLLRERAPDSPDDLLLPSDVVPEKMIAQGKVAIESSQLSGKINLLELKVDYAESNLVLGQPDGSSSQPGRLAIAGQQGRNYQVTGNRLDVLVTVRDKQPEVTSLDMDGDVVFREAKADATTQPLVVQGRYLHVANADLPTAELELHGQPGMPATITAAGMKILAATLRLNRGESKAWIDSPGELHLPMKKDFNGKPLGGLHYLVVTWQGGMELVNDVISFHGKVVANTNEGSLQTEHLRVVLNQPVRFDGAVQQQATELAQLECHQGVFAEFKQRDAAGLVSVQTMRLQSFVANQLTGELRGTGPGELESTHLANSSKNLAGFADVVPAGAAAGQRLRFLRVEFKRDVRGNLHQNGRRVEVSGDAKAIYGPIDTWGQRLELSVRRNPGPETILISSDRLAVAESPLAMLNRTSSFGPLELHATGDVRIEGSYGQQGTFTTSSQSATYDQQKTMFILEGDPATLTRQEFVGAPFSEAAFRKLIYNQATGEIKGEGFAGGNFKQSAIRPHPSTSR